MDSIRALPAPPPYELWMVSLATAPSAADIDLLSQEERAKASRFAFSRDERRYLGAHVALRKILARSVGDHPARLQFSTGGFGKPMLVHERSRPFSLSHSDDLALIAMAKEFEIGVDVESNRPVPGFEALAARHFTESEQDELMMHTGTARNAAFLRCWTRKEACVKAVGSGLSVAPHRFFVGTSHLSTVVAVPTKDGAVAVTVCSLSESNEVFGSLARALSSNRVGGESCDAIDRVADESIRLPQPLAKRLTTGPKAHRVECCTQTPGKGPLADGS